MHNDSVKFIFNLNATNNQSELRIIVELLRLFTKFFEMFLHAKSVSEVTQYLEKNCH